MDLGWYGNIDISLLELLTRAAIYIQTRFGDSPGVCFCELDADVSQEVRYVDSAIPRVQKNFTPMVSYF